MMAAAYDKGLQRMALHALQPLTLFIALYRSVPPVAAF